MLRQRKKGKIIGGGCRGPMCIPQQTQEEHTAQVEENREFGFNLQSQERQQKDIAHTLLLKQKDIANDKLDALKEQFKGCWINADGNAVCPRSGNIFVSPEQFGRNLDNFIQNDLPKGLTIALAGSLLLPTGLLPLVVLAPAVGVSRGLTFNKSGFGVGSGRKRKRKL